MKILVVCILPVVVSAVPFYFLCTGFYLHLVEFKKPAVNIFPLALVFR